MRAKQIPAPKPGVEAVFGRGLNVANYLVVAVLVAVPVVHSNWFLHSYNVPKFAILLITCSILACVLAWLRYIGMPFSRPGRVLVWIVSGYLAALAISTVAGVSPIISLQGSFQNLMGLSTYGCYGVLAISICAAAGRDLGHFGSALRAITIAGLLVSLAGVAQFAGIMEIDPGAGRAFGDRSRIYATIGHPDFAGNFLLYVVFGSEAVAMLSRRSRWQTVAGVTCVLGIIALVFTGTRGAWAGLLAGMAAGVVVGLKEGIVRLASRKAAVRAGLAGLLLIALFGAGIKYTSLGAPIRARIADTGLENFTGSGRIADWKLAIRMLPRYWFTGCGPEAFRLAQLPFKTDEYARATTGVDAEDPHNDYLSSLVSTGVLGFSLYLLLICWAIRCYWRAIQAAEERDQKAAGTVLLAGMAAVLVHGFFLHHIVSTGVYFFAFVGLGPAWLQVQEGARQEVDGKGELASATRDETEARGQSRPRQQSTLQRTLRASIVCVSGLLVVAAVGYSYRLLRAEFYIVQCLSAAAAGDPASVVEKGGVAAAVPLYQTDINAYYGGALQKVSAGQAEPISQPLLRLALEEMSRATSRTLSPVGNLVVLSLTRIEAGDTDGGAQAAEDAEYIDPHSYLPHLAWSTLYLRQGRLDRAVDEYKAAQSLGAPYSNIQDLHFNLGRAIRKSDSAELWYRLTGEVLVRKDKRGKKEKTQSVRK